MGDRPTLDERLAARGVRTQHRRRWRGKRFSVRKRKVTDTWVDKAVDHLMARAIAELWRRGMW